MTRTLPQILHRLWPPLLGIFVFLLVGEVALRLSDGGARIRALWQGAAPDIYYRPATDDGLPYTMTPNARLMFEGLSAHTDSHGYRRTGESGDDEDAWRVLCLGDSVTLGVGSRDAETWPSQLAGLLNRTLPEGKSVRCWNLAQNGYNCEDIVATARHWIARRKPHSVVYMFVGNDLDDPMTCAPSGCLVPAGRPPTFPETYVFTGQSLLLRGDLASEIAQSKAGDRLHWSRSRLAEMVTGGAVGAMIGAALPFPFIVQGSTPESANRWTSVERDIERLRDLCIEADAELVVLHFAWRGYSDTEVVLAEAMCDRLGVAYDTVARDHTLEEFLTKFSTGRDYHPGVEGCRLLAERAAGLLLKTEAADNFEAVAPRGLWRHEGRFSDDAFTTRPAPTMSPVIDFATGAGFDQVMGGVGRPRKLCHESVFVFPPPKDADDAFELEIAHELASNQAREVTVDIEISAGLRSVGHARGVAERKPGYSQTFEFPLSSFDDAPPVSSRDLAESFWEVRVRVSPYWRPTAVEQSEGAWSESVRVFRLGWKPAAPEGESQ